MTVAIRLKSLLLRPSLILNPILLLAFVAVWIRDFLYWLPKDAFGTAFNYWAYTDWLIDYSQGFIRRGLSGEIWRLVPDQIPPLQFVAVFSWVLILAVAFGYLRMLARSWNSVHPLTLFGLLFLPSLFMFYLHDHNAIGRKEILGYITVLLHLLVVEKTFPLAGGPALPEGNLRRYVRWLLPITVILLPAVILVHEGNFLLFVPLHAMITLSVLQMRARPNFLQSALWTGLLYLPAAVTLAGVYLSGTPPYQMVRNICDQWLAAGAIREGTCYLPPDRLSGSTLPGSFNPMTWTLSRAFTYTKVIIPMNWKAWVLILPALFLPLWYLVRQAVYGVLRSRSTQTFSPSAARRYTGVFFRKYFLVPFLLSLPVYLTAYDYGRWFAITSINYAMLAVSENLPAWEFARRKQAAGEETAAETTPEHLDHRLVFYGVSILICLLALVLWLPHFCLFKCEVIRSPLEFLSHSYIAR